jgi:hypothetical protein
VEDDCEPMRGGLGGCLKCEKPLLIEWGGVLCKVLLIYSYFYKGKIQFFFRMTYLSLLVLITRQPRGLDVV